jgi:hypothetical protein
LKVKNHRLVLLAIFLLFFGPVLLAVLMRSDWWDFMPAGKSNLGTLVHPPVAAGVRQAAIVHPPEAALPPANWTILYPFTGACDRDCRETVSVLRQVHLATGRHRDRVTLILLAPGDISKTDLMGLLELYPDLVIATDRKGATGRALAGLEAVPGTFGDGRAFILDPPGNIMLAYASGFDPNHVNKDLKRLLTWSAQDE